VAFDVQTQLLDCLLVHHKSLLAFVEAIVDRMRADFSTVFAITKAELVYEVLVGRVAVILYNLYRAESRGFKYLLF
jgi:hypothetical protein